MPETDLAVEGQLPLLLYQTSMVHHPYKACAKNKASLWESQQHRGW